MAAADLPHPLEHRAAEPAALRRRPDLDRHRRERVRLATLFPQSEPELDHPVDPGREPVRRAVPRARDRVPLREHDVLVLVVEDELKLGEVVVEPFPVAVQDVAVRVVRGPDVEVDPIAEIRPLRMCHEIGHLQDPSISLHLRLQAAEGPSNVLLAANGYRRSANGSA